MRFAPEAAPVTNDFNRLHSGKAFLQVLLPEFTVIGVDKDADAAQDFAPEAFRITIPCVFDDGKSADELVSCQFREELVER